MKTLSTEVSANDIGSFAEIIEKYGAGVLAIAVLAVLFIFIIKYLVKSNEKLLDTFTSELKKEIKENVPVIPEPQRELFSKEELKEFVIEIVRDEVKMLTEEKSISVLDNHIKISSNIKPCLERAKTDFNADRVAAYVFHNGMHSSHGLPFYKYTCLSEVIRRDKGITQVINEQKALPLTMIDDNIAIMLNREGWFVICDADKESDKYPLVIGQMGRNLLKSAIGVSIYSVDGDILGFVMVEFKKSKTKEELEGIVCRVKDRCDSLTTVFDFRRNKENILG